MTLLDENLTLKIGFQQVKAAANIIKDKLNLPNFKNKAPIGIVLGSGWGEFANNIKKQSNYIEIEYKEISHFPLSSIDGHSGKLLFAKFKENYALIMQGRVHLYEGYSPSQVVFHVRVLLALGIKNLLLTNAAGGISNNLNIGDLMIINDHINLTGNNPLLGANDIRFGTRFLDVSQIYSLKLRKLAHKIGKKLKVNLKEGTYAGVLGPIYETPAEIQMIKTIGGDAVGMSTIYEAIAAHHQNINILGLSCITNKAAGLFDGKLYHHDVKSAAYKVSNNFSSLLLNLISELT